MQALFLPPISLCCPITLEANVGVMEIDVESSLNYFASKCDSTWNDVSSNSSIRKYTPIDIHGYLLNVYGHHTLPVSTDRWWAMHFSRGKSDVGDKLLCQPTKRRAPLLLNWADKWRMMNDIENIFLTIRPISFIRKSGSPTLVLMDYEHGWWLLISA